MNVRLLNHFRMQEANKKLLPYILPNIRVVSFPRSGRTWVKRMTQALMLEMGIDNYQQFMMFKHDGSRIRKLHIPARKYIRDKDFYKDNRVVLMVREPRDVVVSHFFMLKIRTHCREMKEMSIGEFFRHPFGMKFAVDFMNEWAEQRDKPRDFHVIYYEDFIKDTLGQLKALMAWCHAPYMPDEVYEKAVKICSFKSMQQDDIQNASPFLDKPIDTSDPNALAVREGKVGTFLKWLNDEDQAWALTYIMDNLNPFFRDRYPLTIGDLHAVQG